MLCCIWNLSSNDQGLNLHPLRWMGGLFPIGPPGQALTMYVLNVFSLFDDGSMSPPCAFSPHWSNFMFVTKAGTPRCQDPRALGPRGTEACSVSGPLCSPGEKVSEHHQEEETGRLCPACLCDPQSELFSAST